MKKLTALAFYQFFENTIPARELAIAYSGGVDSHVLLHLMNECRKINRDLRLRAFHVNHGLSANALQWQNHCEQVCNQMNIPLSVFTLQLDCQIGDSVEAVAREERYRVMSEQLQSGEFVLTAHNADDQAETFLVQLMRGSGVKGLASMPASKSMGTGMLYRPLLNFTRAQLEEYATDNNLHWIEDESNQNTRFTRNFLRHEIVPLLRQRWPSVAQSLVRSAEHCAQADELLMEIAEQDFRDVTSSVDALSIEKLRRLSSHRQANVLRYWIMIKGFSLPSTQRLREVLELISLQYNGFYRCVSWGSVEMKRDENNLILNEI